MKKILPINPNPYIRTYTHHGYHHAIISTPDKVSTDSHKVAKVEVKNFNNYTWNIQNQDLQYEIGPNDNFNFYSNKWETNMNIAFWRPCNYSDEIEISIHHQLYSNVWASIAVFLTDTDREIMTDIDSSYIIQCGNFSKDGPYYRINAEPHIIALSSPALPLTIRLIRTGELITVQYYDTNQKKKEITIKDTLIERPLELIGFTVNLGCNSYYEWLFSNFINFYVNPNLPIPMDYLCNIHKNWSLHTNNYFLDFSAENEQEINELGFSLIDYIKHMIDQNKYIETLINDNMHYKIADTNGKYFHQNLIYGYDDSLQQFYLLYYKQGKIQISTMLYKDFLSPCNYIPSRTIYVLKYNPGYEVYKLTIQHLLQILRECKASNNISYYEPQYITQYQFGLAGFQILIDENNDNLIIDDIRLAYLIYERSVCNRDRIEYLFFKKYLSLDNFNHLYKLSINECRQASILLNTVIKQRIQLQKEPQKIKKHIKLIIEIERNIIDNLIASLRSH